MYNGLSWEDYSLPELNKKREYYHFLGKASWSVKNLLGACKIAVKTNNRLLVMGGNRWTYKNIKYGARYKLSSLINYLGLVDNVSKMKVMQESKGLFFPVLWNEPFGLAIIESLYAGCPVYGLKNGFLPELINEDVGYLGDSVEDIISKIDSFNFSPIRCHHYAKEVFSSEVMAENYLKYYKEVIRGEGLNEVAPKLI